MSKQELINFVRPLINNCYFDSSKCLISIIELGIRSQLIPLFFGNYYIISYIYSLENCNN